MSSLRDRGIAALVRRQKQARGVTVTYTRDALAVPVVGWCGNTLFARTTKEPGASVVWGERDYFIAVADLEAAGVPMPPQKGDTITETIDGRAVTFGLSTPTGEPVWRYEDQTRQILRFHCKRV